MSDRMRRTLVIETEIDRKTLNNSEQVVKNFFDRYSDKKMKVSTPDFQGILQPIRDIEKEIDRVAEKMPHMLGAVSVDKTFLSDIKEAFKDVKVMFTDGSSATGFDEIIEKTKTLAIQAVDLGDFLSSLQNSAKGTVEALKQIGAVRPNWQGKNMFSFGDLNVDQLQQAIGYVHELVKAQSELDSFHGTPLKNEDLYSNLNTDSLTSYLKKAEKDLQDLRRFNLETVNELWQRRGIESNIDSGRGGRYDDWDFIDVKRDAEQDEAQYRRALSELQEYIAEREALLQRLNESSHLFSNEELFGHQDVLTSNINNAKKQIQELQSIGNWDKITNPPTGDFTEITRVLNEIKGSLQVISDAFKNEDAAMRSMAENGVASFTSLSEAIASVYNNLNQVVFLVDSISQKDFNVTNITQMGGGDSNLQAMTKQMAVARETQEHLRRLYEQAAETLELLGQSGQVGLVMDYAGQLQELNMTDINKSVKGANTEMKLASVLAEMQDYIEKLTQINEIRNKYNLGEWKDTFVPTQQSVVQFVPQQKPQSIVVPEPATPQLTTTSVGSTEAQQMWQLQAAVDEVNKAVGRKNAGFVQEGQIVGQVVPQEIQQLQELARVIGTDIANVLSTIKGQFAEAFDVPELDKGKLQASFDEVYNKFVDLRDKIGAMEIDVGINSANITTAIQEALYAKEIAANYKKVEFSDIFESNFDYGTWTNRFTGDVFDTFDAVDKEFDEVFKDFFTSKDGWFMGTKDEMLADLFSKQNINIEPQQNDWAQVIVEAINTQGGRIVETIKLILPKNISENVDVIDEKELTNAFQVLVKAISDFGQQTGKKPDAFFRSIESNNSYASSIRTPEVDNALRTLGLLSNSGEITFTLPDTGARNIGVAIGEQLVVSGQEKENVSNASELMNKLNEAASLGASVPRILSLIEKNNIPLGWAGRGDAVFQLQTRSSGVNIASPRANNDFSGVTDEQIDRLIHTFEVMSKVGLYPDFIGDNILLDKEKGFSLIDLETENIHGRSMDDAQDMVQAFLKNVFREANLSSSDFQQFSSRVNQRLKLPAEQRLVNADTIVAEQMAVSQTKTESKPSGVKITPTMDDGAVAKVVADNVAKTPATVKVTPIMDNTTTNSENAINGETQSAVDAAKSFVDAAKAKQQFVEANKKVAESAKVSEEAVEKEAEAAKSVANAIGDSAQTTNPTLAKERKVLDAKGNQLLMAETEKYNTSQAAITKTTTTRQTALGEVTTTTIIRDFEKLAKETEKTEKNIARAQSQLDKFVKTFRDKSGGTAQFIEGFSELENFKIDANNIEDAFNKMNALEGKFSELQGNFRKGKSSLNPFVNAITQSEKIGDIFADAQDKFNGLAKPSAGLTQKFDKLRTLSEEMAAFVKRMNKDPISISSADFEAFSKQVGEFTVLKSQVESGLKREVRTQAVDVAKQKKDYEEILRLVKERNDALVKAAKAETDSEEQKNANMDAIKAQEQLHTLGKQIVLTEEQRIEMGRIREEQARRIRDVEANNRSQEDKRKTTLTEQQRKKEAQAYLELIKLRNEYEKKAAKEGDGSKMQAFYNEQVVKFQNQINQNDRRAILNQEDQNKLLAIEEAHQRAIAEILLKKSTSGTTKKNNRFLTTEDEKIQAKFDAGYINQDQYNNWQTELAEYRKYITGVTKADETMVQEKKGHLTRLYDQLNKISNVSKSFFTSGGEILSEDQWLDPSKINNVSTALQDLYNHIVPERFAGMKTEVTGVSDKLGKLNFTVDDGAGQLTGYTIALHQTSGAVKLLNNNTKPTLTTLQKFTQSFKKDFTGLLHAVTGGTGIYTVIRYLREGVQAVRELDLAMTELKKVTDETDATYDKFLDTASRIGIEIGSTITQVTEATATFAKLGYSMEMATEMAQAALVYKNVGDEVASAEDAAESIISTMKGFRLEASEAMRIVDRFNEVGNNFSITSTGIGEALKVSASALSEGGNSIDESIALITAAM